MKYKTKEERIAARNTYMHDYLLAYRQRPEVKAKQLADYHRKYDGMSFRERRDFRLRKDHNISLEQFEARLQQQNNCCALCGEPFINETPNVDHDHACCPTGKRSCGKCIRGLVHETCNKALGLLHDRVELFLRAAQYLTERGAVNNGQRGETSGQ